MIITVSLCILGLNPLWLDQNDNGDNDNNDDNGDNGDNEDNEDEVRSEEVLRQYREAQLHWDEERVELMNAHRTEMNAQRESFRALVATLLGIILFLIIRLLSL